MKNSSFFLFSSLVACAVLVPLFFPLTVCAQFLGTDKSENLNKNNFFISELEHQVFVLINQKRTQHGLQPVSWNEQAAKVARLHSNNMSSFNFFSHIGLDGKKVSGRADSLSLKNWRMLGEIIAYSRGSKNPVERVVELWMQSPGHRRNLLRKNWKESGVGIGISPNGTYFFTQVFMKK